MGGVDQNDGHTFSINFTCDGVAKLRNRVGEKLKEFMGDYTDDSLVEYVIILLRNGRSKGEARSELNVFLGDDSDSFVSWLWGHLASNLEMYVQPRQPVPGDDDKSVTALGTSGNKSDPKKLNSESDGEKSPKVIRSRRKREWKGIVRDAADPPPLRSSEIDKMHVEDNNHHKINSLKRALSPRKHMHSKRNHPDERRPNVKRPDGGLPDEKLPEKRQHDEKRHDGRRPDERHHMKKAGTLEAATSATRRLLQFAVRDAVGITRPSIASNNAKFKRLRSAVSASANDASFDGFPQSIQSIARMSNAAAVAVNAVAEAAKDVVKYSYGANIIDRLSPSMDVTENIIEFGLAAVEDECMPHFNQGADYEKTYLPNYFQGDDFNQGDDYEKAQSPNYFQGDDYGEPATFDNDNVFVYHSAYDNEGYGYDVANSPKNHVSQTDHPIISNTLLKSHYYEHHQRAALATTSCDIMNSPADESTRRPLHYHTPIKVSRVNNQQHLRKEKSVIPIIKENNIRATLHNGNGKPATSVQNEAQKKVPSFTGPHSSIQALEDADSRTIFVNNVHFAATKESLCKHFNKFGEVLKVVIVTDAATGQPKGSAYVEFKQRVEAELALSSDSTSFMSRILKVSKTSAAVVPQEAAPAVTWPRVARVARFSRSPFPRGIHTAFRARPLIKPGARSLQWKRDSPMTPVATGVPSPTSRNLTYVRTA